MRNAIHVVLVLMLTAGTSLACPPPLSVKVTNAFSVVVRDGAQTLPNIKVTLRPDKVGAPEVSGLANSRGIADFAAVPQGTYTVTAEVPPRVRGLGIGPFAKIEVVADNTPDVERSVTVEDFGPPPIRVRMASGRLVEGFLGSVSDSSDKPLAQRALALVRRGSWQTVATTVTAADGTFEFPNVAPDQYVIVIEPDKEYWSPRGDVALDVISESTVPDRVTIALQMTSCGLLYKVRGNTQAQKS